MTHLHGLLSKYGHRHCIWTQNVTDYQSLPESSVPHFHVWVVTQGTAPDPGPPPSLPLVGKITISWLAWPVTTLHRTLTLKIGKALVTRSLHCKHAALQARTSAVLQCCTTPPVVLGDAESVARTELSVLMLLQCGLAVARRVVERSLAALGRAAAGRGRTSSSLTTHHHHYYSLPSHPARARRQPSLDLKWKYGNCEREVERLNTDLDKLLPRRFLNWLEIFFQ